MHNKHPSEHPDREVQAALIRLLDAVCQWERGTGRESVLIYKEEGWGEVRAMSGKPIIPSDVTDAQIIQMIERKANDERRR